MLRALFCGGRRDSNPRRREPQWYQKTPFAINHSAIPPLNYT